MTKGKRSQAVNARLRSDLAAAAKARALLERRVKDAEEAQQRAELRMDEVLEKGHPEWRAAVARAKAQERKVNELVAAGEKNDRYMADNMRDSLRTLIRSAMDSDLEFLTSTFAAVLHELYGSELYDWYAEFDPSGGYASRQKRRADANMPTQKVYSTLVRAERERNPGRANRAKGLAAVARAKEARHASYRQASETER